MTISKLKPFFNEVELDHSFNKEQVDELYEKFKEDFVYNAFEVGGKKIRIIHQKSRIKQYADYSETYTHIISRKSHIAGARIYEADRANRVHWIKPILLEKPCKDIFYYRWKDDDGVCKHHYWYYDKDFMVVTKDITPDLQIVTSFCVDQEEKVKFYERYKDYSGGKDCL